MADEIFKNCRLILSDKVIKHEESTKFLMTITSLGFKISGFQPLIIEKDTTTSEDIKQLTDFLSSACEFKTDEGQEDDSFHGTRDECSSEYPTSDFTCSDDSFVIISGTNSGGFQSLKSTDTHQENAKACATAATTNEVDELSHMVQGIKITGDDQAKTHEALCSNTVGDVGTEASDVKQESQTVLCFIGSQMSQDMSHDECPEQYKEEKSKTPAQPIILDEEVGNKKFKSTEASGKGSRNSFDGSLQIPPTAAPRQNQQGLLKNRTPDVTGSDGSKSSDGLEPTEAVTSSDNSDENIREDGADAALLGEKLRDDEQNNSIFDAKKSDRGGEIDTVHEEPAETTEKNVPQLDQGSDIHNPEQEVTSADSLPSGKSGLVDGRKPDTSDTCSKKANKRTIAQRFKVGEQNKQTTSLNQNEFDSQDEEETSALFGPSSTGSEYQNEKSFLKNMNKESEEDQREVSDEKQAKKERQEKRMRYKENRLKNEAMQKQNVSSQQNTNTCKSVSGDTSLFEVREKLVESPKDSNEGEERLRKTREHTRFHESITEMKQGPLERQDEEIGSEDRSKDRHSLKKQNTYGKVTRQGEIKTKLDGNAADRDQEMQTKNKPVVDDTTKEGKEQDRGQPELDAENRDQSHFKRNMKTGGEQRRQGRNQQDAENGNKDREQDRDLSALHRKNSFESELNAENGDQTPLQRNSDAGREHGKPGRNQQDAEIGKKDKEKDRASPAPPRKDSFKSELDAESRDQTPFKRNVDRERGKLGINQQDAEGGDKDEEKDKASPALHRKDSFESELNARDQTPFKRNVGRECEKPGRNQQDAESGNKDKEQDRALQALQKKDGSESELDAESKDQTPFKSNLIASREDGKQGRHQQDAESGNKDEKQDREPPALHWKGSCQTDTEDKEREKNSSDLIEDDSELKRQRRHDLEGEGGIQDKEQEGQNRNQSTVSRDSDNQRQCRDRTNEREQEIQAEKISQGRQKRDESSDNKMRKLQIEKGRHDASMWLQRKSEDDSNAQKYDKSKDFRGQKGQQSGGHRQDRCHLNAEAEDQDSGGFNEDVEMVHTEDGDTGQGEERGYKTGEDRQKSEESSEEDEAVKPGGYCEVKIKAKKDDRFREQRREDRGIPGVDKPNNETIAKGDYKDRNRGQKSDQTKDEMEDKDEKVGRQRKDSKKMVSKLERDDQIAAPGEDYSSKGSSDESDDSLDLDNELVYEMEYLRFRLAKHYFKGKEYHSYFAQAKKHGERYQFKLNTNQQKFIEALRQLRFECIEISDQDEENAKFIAQQIESNSKAVVIDGNIHIVGSKEGVKSSKRMILSRLGNQSAMSNVFQEYPEVSSPTSNRNERSQMFGGSRPASGARPKENMSTPPPLDDQIQRFGLFPTETNVHHFSTQDHKSCRLVDYSQNGLPVYNGRHGDLKIQIYNADITKLQVHCIVNAANTKLNHAGGVASVIAKAAGKELKDACEEYIDSGNTVGLTNIFVSPAGNLPASCVIHAVGPKWDFYADKDKCIDDLRHTVLRCLLEAACRDKSSIALPSISAAIFKVPQSICAKSYMEAAKIFDEFNNKELKSRLNDIRFVDVNDGMVNTVQECFMKHWEDPLDQSAKFKDFDFCRLHLGSRQLSSKVITSQPQQNRSGGRGHSPARSVTSPSPPGASAMRGQHHSLNDVQFQIGGIQLSISSKPALSIPSSLIITIGDVFDKLSGIPDYKVKSYKKSCKEKYQKKDHYEFFMLNKPDGKRGRLLCSVKLERKDSGALKLKEAFGLMGTALVIAGIQNQIEVKKVTSVIISSSLLYAEASNKKQQKKDTNTLDKNDVSQFAHHLFEYLQKSSRDSQLKQVTIAASEEAIPHLSEVMFSRGLDVKTLGSSTGGSPWGQQHFSSRNDQQRTGRGSSPMRSTHKMTSSPGADSKTDQGRTSRGISPARNMPGSTSAPGAYPWPAQTTQSGMGSTVRGRSPARHMGAIGSPHRGSESSVDPQEECLLCKNKQSTQMLMLPCCGQQVCLLCKSKTGRCPFCDKPFGTPRGNQPDGTMEVFYSPMMHAPGHEDAGVYKIIYTFLQGLQKPGHPSPGEWYSGDYRTAFIPASQEGFHVLLLLRLSFMRGLTFTIGSSAVRKKDNVIIWNGIHHKTNLNKGERNSYSYPDPAYLRNVTRELADKGVTLDSMSQDERESLDRFAAKIMSSGFFYGK